MRRSARVQIPVFPGPALVFSHELLVKLPTRSSGFPVYEVHVYSPNGAKATAQSEYGVITYLLTCLFENDGNRLVW
jgi:hypothetical protein